MPRVPGCWFLISISPSLLFLLSHHHHHHHHVSRYPSVVTERMSSCTETWISPLILQAFLTKWELLPDVLLSIKLTLSRSSDIVKVIGFPEMETNTQRYNASREAFCFNFCQHFVLESTAVSLFDLGVAQLPSPFPV